MENLYVNPYEDENLSVDYEDAQWKMQQLEKKIHKLKRKKKGKKKSKRYKLKKKIKRLELEQEQLKQFVIFFAYQYKAQLNQQPWWQGAICNTLPKALELATATINKLPDKTRPLCITDGSDRKKIIGRQNQEGTCIPVSS